jgi:hypothetical protein
MQNLHEEFRRAFDAEVYEPLLLCAAYILDFTVIHPFRDGDGRMSRLITLWLLYIVGHDVGRFISLEKIIDASKETYYEALGQSTAGWHEGERSSAVDGLLPGHLDRRVQGVREPHRRDRWPRIQESIDHDLHRLADGPGVHDRRCPASGAGSQRWLHQSCSASSSRPAGSNRWVRAVALGGAD